MRKAWIAAVVLAVSACGPEDDSSQIEAVDTGIEIPVATPGAQAHLRTGELKVMTQNLYIGAEVAPILISPVEQTPLLVAEAFSQIQATSFPLRARELAREIKAAAPDLIGLQEAELILVQSPGDLLSGSSAPATEIVYDYLEILLDELDRLGLCYEPAVIGVQTDIELPAATSTGYDDIRLVDRDVILARCGVQTSRPRARHFKVNLVVPVGGLGSPVAWVPIVRGWQEVDARIGLRTFRFVNTHLEPAVLPQVGAIQLAQAKQLLIELADERLPMVLVGDFNSAADGSTTKTYTLLTHSGFMDAWRLAREDDPGYTCCQAPDLQNPESLLNRRIDFVFVRDWYDFWLDWKQGGVSAEVVSDERMAGDILWPSDHAGTVASFRIFARPRLVHR